MIKSYKHLIVIPYIFVGLSCFFPSRAQAQVDVSDNIIPYGFNDFDWSLIYTRNHNFIYEPYTLKRDVIYAGQTFAIEGRGVNEKTYTGIGGAFDLRFAMFYQIFTKNKSRLRIADDIALGTALTSYSKNVKDALTNQKIEPEYLQSMAGIDGSITLYLGAQAMYRISNTFDVGVKFTPFFVNFTSNIKNSGKSYGLHLRVNRFYLDYRRTPYVTEKNSGHYYESKGLQYYCVKYILPDEFTFYDNGYVFASLNSYTYKPLHPWYDENGYGYDNAPQGYENFKFEKNHLKILRIGMGILF